MKNLILLLLISSFPCGNLLGAVKAPTAKRIDKKLEKHGDVRNDPYYWMKERKDPEVVKYLEAENKYTKSQMAPQKALEEKVFKEMTSRIKLADQSASYESNGYFYFSKTTEKDNYRRYYRVKKGFNKSELILDVNELAKGHSYTSVGSQSISPNNNILAYAHDTKGRRIYTIYFKNLSTGKLLDHKIENVSSNFTWAEDGNTFFYGKQDPKTLRRDKIYRYDLKSKKSTLVYQEKDETFGAYVWKTLTNKYIMIGSYSTLTSESRYIDAKKPLSKFKVFQKRQRGVEYSIDDGGDKFYILTNINKSKNFQVMETSKDKTESKNWKVFIEHNDKIFLERMTVLTNHIILSEKKNGLDYLKVINRNSKKSQYIEFKDSAYVVGGYQNAVYNTDQFLYSYESMTTPSSVFQFDLNNHQSKLIKQKEVLGGFKSEKYVSDRIYATSRDGVKIPLSIVYKKGVKKDGKNPGLIYGYGSYGNTIPPYFSTARISLLDRGFVYVVAHIRGSSINGRQWYDDGKMFKKKNTFRDFVDASEYLIKSKWVAKNKLFASGGSAGGLLMGAVINMRPDLYLGINAAVPFVDVVTTMLDDSIPLTTGEYDEWGNPNKKDSYKYMKSYSPYDQVKKQKYPNILVTTGFHDSQVQYWEPAKWVAKLRHMKTDSNLLLFKTNMDAGHSGASGRFDGYKEVAFKYAFYLKLLNYK